MPTGIRFPPGLRPPDRDGYEDADEETRSEFQADTGAPRRRNKYRIAPRVFDLQWSFTQAEYYAFDYWVQHTISGGALEFDIQLLDDDETLVWYTVTGVGEFSYEISDPEGELRYRVRWKVRAKAENFGETRPAGTDELMGRATVGVTTRGALLVYTPFRGSTSVGVTSAKGRLSLPGLRGSINVGMYQLPRARFGPMALRGLVTVGVEEATGAIDIAVIHYFPELSRQWQDLDWMSGGLSGQDINTEPDVVQREWMGV